MPPGIRVFLVYAFAILALIGLSMRWVVDQAIEQPISPIGIVWMGLLAYTIFTITLVLQRKEAARGLALGLASLSIPAVPLLALSALLPAALAMTVVALVLFRGLTRPAIRAYLAEP
jgi:MFS superfamily sulfate permease-like transporter